MKATERRIDDTLVLCLEGPLDLTHGAALRRLLLDAVARARRVLVDLSGVTLADSSLAANLVEALGTARKAGVDFALTAVRPAVLRLLQLARLDQVFDLRGDSA
ncbi:MAG: STAS domain-containing protein [Hyphomicrobiales bacterium]|nr:STAS domain-containing protein [Hyphomicrobiales bacterium]MCP5371622.1 STAS domain-containing protein [Hyphomicrobiales bacterium]